MRLGNGETIGVSEYWYYDQALTKIEKGELIDRVLTLNSRVSSGNKFPYGVVDNRLISLLQENNSEKANFSFADNNIHELKRKYAQKLAKELYSRIGKGWDASNPLKPTEYPRPTEADRYEISTQEMDFLDEDIEFVCDRAEAILAKMISGTGKRNVVDVVPSFEILVLVSA